MPVGPFSESLHNHGQWPLKRQSVSTLQINLGKLCNQACRHCHVEAGPSRTEIMEKTTVDEVLRVMDESPTVATVDLTGGAPELNPHFRYLVRALRDSRIEVIDRCNLTVLFEKGQEDLALFLADHRVRVIASLPCYSDANVDKQRGKGVFAKSIRGLKILNSLGYGHPSSGLSLDLVFNPLGAFLPPNQTELEKTYHEKLKADFGIVFNRLFAITNMPIKRFGEDLIRSNQWESYLDLLFQNFNPMALDGLMCRSLVSIGWDGKLYDCDFNQMLELELETPLTLSNLKSFSDLSGTSISVAGHCYGCTAGAGSSCTGQLNEEKYGTVHA